MHWAPTKVAKPHGLNAATSAVALNAAGELFIYPSACPAPPQHVQEDDHQQGAGRGYQRVAEEKNAHNAEQDLDGDDCGQVPPKRMNVNRTLIPA